MAQYLSQITRFIDHTLLAISITSISALIFLVLLITAVVAAYIKRKEIESRLADEERVLYDDVKMKLGMEGLAQRNPLQAHRSAVIPDTPNDPWRRAYTRLNTATNLREAASNVLDNNAKIKRAQTRAKMLGAIYQDEKAKARTAIIRKELGVFILLATVGAIAAFGLN